MGQSSARLIEMNVFQAIRKVSAPVVVANLTQTAIESITFGMLGSLGAESLAAVGFGRNVFWWATSWLWALGMAVMALVARAIGADDPDRARRTLIQALLTGIVITTVTAVLGITTAYYTLPLLGAEPMVVELGVPYLQAMFLSAPFMINFFFGIFALRAVGETGITLWLQSGVGLLQLLLSRVLIFGWGPVPPLKLVGGGLAIVLSRAAGLCAVIYIFMSGKSRIRIRPQDISLKPHWPTVLTLFKVSIPNALEWLGADTQRMLLLRIIASTPLSTFAVSAVTVGRQVEEIYSTIGMGMATAAGTLVGQNLGAKRPERAEESALKVNYVTTVLFLIAAAAFLLFPASIVRVFCSDQEVIEPGAWYLRMLGIVAPAYAASLVFAGSLRGAADTRTPMKVALACLWGIQMPLAYVLGQKTPAGLYGVYISYGAFWIIQALWLKRHFDKGLWKQIAV